MLKEDEFRGLLLEARSWLERESGEPPNLSNALECLADALTDLEPLLAAARRSGAREIEAERDALRSRVEELEKELYEVKLMRELLPADSVAREILRERLRQIHKEGWSREHDDAHTDGALAAAAAWYSIPEQKKVIRMAALEALGQDPLWPFSEAPKQHSRRRELVIAAALLMAEIERLDRLDAALGGGTGGV